MHSEKLRSDGTAWLLVALMLGGMLMLSGCNTASGLGEDVEAAGDTLSDTAEDVQD